MADCCGSLLSRLALPRALAADSDGAQGLRWWLRGIAVSAHVCGGYTDGTGAVTSSTWTLKTFEILYIHILFNLGSLSYASSVWSFTLQ